MIRRGWFLLLVPVAAVLLAGCGDTEPPAGPPEPPEVQVSVPIADTLTDYEVFTGRTQAIQFVDIRARVTGYLEQAPFKQGADVKKGDVLFVLQQKPFQDAVRQAKAVRDQQKAQLAYQDSVYRRNMELIGKTAVGSEELEQTLATRNSTRAALEAAEAAVAIAQQNLDWSVIRAPFNGRISRRLVDSGNDVMADNTILASLVQVDPLYAYFDVDERTLLHIGHLLPEGKVPADAVKKFPLMLGLANEKPEDFSHPGTLEFADNRVEATTGTLRMWGTFQNHAYDLKPGLFIRIRMGVGQPRPALFIAESALGSDQGRRFVYVINDENKVVYTPVETGQRKNGRIAIESGLNGKERIIVDGLQRVRQKMEVNPQSVPMPRAKDPATTMTLVGRKGAAPSSEKH
jgi:RND family efflux transporter MFP subunit